MKNKENEIKIKIKKSYDKKDLKDLSGPMMDDIHKKSSRWKKLPVKNIVEIKDNGGKKIPRRKIFFKIFIIIFIILAVFALIAGYLYFNYSIAKDKTAELVPYEASLYGKLNIKSLIDFPGSDKPVALDGRMDFVGNYLINAANNEIFAYGLDFSQDVKPFLGENFSFSFIDSADDAGFVLLLEVLDVDALKNILSKIKFKSQLTEENYENIIIYKLSGDDKNSELYLSFLNSHLVVSKKRTGVAAVIDTFYGKRLNLAQNKEYHRASPWFLFNEIAYIYAKPREIDKLLNSESNLFNIWSAATYKIDSTFLALKEKKNGLLLDISLNGSDYEFDGGLNNKLIDLLPANNSIFMAGKNLSKDWKEMQSDISVSNPALEFYLADSLRKFEESARIDDGDLLKFFENDFLVSLDYSGDKINYNLITKFSDNSQAEANMNIFEEAASNYFGNKYPKKQKMMLSDGTEATELMPDPESFQFTDLDFEGKIAHVIEGESLGHEISYIINDNVVIISTSLGSLKNIVSATSENDKLTKKRFFSYPYSQVYQSGSNNILYFDNKVLQDYFKFDNILGKTFSMFDNTAISVRVGEGKLKIKSFLYIE